MHWITDSLHGTTDSPPKKNQRKFVLKCLSYIWKIPLIFGTKHSPYILQYFQPVPGSFRRVLWGMWVSYSKTTEMYSTCSWDHNSLYAKSFGLYRRFCEKTNFRDVSWSDKHHSSSVTFHHRCRSAKLADRDASNAKKNISLQLTDLWEFFIMLIIFLRGLRPRL
jgi:hypothetical protein